MTITRSFYTTITLFAVLFFSVSVLRAGEIHPMIAKIQYWLTYPAADGLKNGMRKSICYENPNHQLSGSTVTYSVRHAGALSRSVKFFSEYYLKYQNDINSYEKLAVYNNIIEFTNLILKHRKYQNGWGWEIPESDLLDGNLQSGSIWYGAVATASTYQFFYVIDNIFAAEGLIAASKIAEIRNDTVNRDKWRTAAMRVGDFLCRIADPYDYYQTKFGAYVMVDANNNPVRKPGMMFKLVSPTEALYTEVQLQNVMAIVPLKELTAVTGDQKYLMSAQKIVDEMTDGLKDFYCSYYPQYNNNGSSKLVSNTYEDNNWHANNGVIDDDQVEYALHALWKFHDLSSNNYTFNYANGSKTFDLMQESQRYHGLPSYMIVNYDSFVSFSGYIEFRNNEWQHTMSYYDMVGFGLLGDLDHALDYSRYLTAWNKVIANKVAGNKFDDILLVMLDSNFNAYWSSANKTYRGTLTPVAIGLSLMTITPYAGSTP